MTRLCGRTLGHYRVGRLIGAGGMGEVYEADDLQLGRRVALKVLPADVATDRDRLARFTREARALAALNHPGIVTIYGVDESEGEHFFTMELVEGRTLSRIIPRQGLALSPLLDIAIPLADALAAAHDKKLVHRDLKPGNVMVTADGRVKVLDFGLVKTFQPAVAANSADTFERTADGALLGTLPYMSPEQLAGRPADTRSDIFSLGVVLYEMAAGRHPFAGRDAAALVAAVVQERPASLATISQAVPIALDRLVARCMEKDPAHRPASAAEVRAALEGLRRDASPAPTMVVIEPPKVPSVAVLPFTDMSPARDQEYFCDGIAEEIINALAQLEGLRVAARTSSFAFKGTIEDVREIGRRLGVRAVLEGSVRKSGDRLRITAQLIDVADGYHLWSERFDRAADDIFAIQDEISLAVVEKLKVKLLAGAPGVAARRHDPSQEAYHLYLKGRYFLNRRGPLDMQRAIEHFEKAIAADAAYAMPHVGIAATFSVLGLWGFLPPGPSFARVKAAASRAIELDDSLLEAHVSLANALLLADWDWRAARSHFERAGKLQASVGLGLYGLSLYYMTVGRRADAMRAATDALKDEPLSAIAHTQAAAIHAGFGEVDQAAALLEKAIELDAAMPMALLWLGFCRGMQGRLEEAVELLRAATEKGLSTALAYLPEVLRRAGRVDEARAAVMALEKIAAERYVPPSSRALAWAALGDKERCFELLGQAETERTPMLTVALIGPGYIALAPDWLREWFDIRRQQIGPAAAWLGARSPATD
jgi:serine/threonine protein kinase/tetratricopeptide (TPR) repeat protein